MDDYDFLLWSDTGVLKSRGPIGGRHEKRPRVLLYISDETASVPFHLTSKFAAIFKNYLPGDFPAERIYSMPLGHVNGVPQCAPVAVNERKYNVFFSGCPQVSRAGFFGILSKLASSADRLPVTKWDLMQCAAESEQPSVFDMSGAFPGSYIHMTPEFLQGLDCATYGKMLQESKIALCPAGWKSAETYRHFEAMRAGCIVVSGPLPNTRLYRDSPIVCLDNWDRLGSTITELLKDEVRMLELQRRTLKWWQEVCSEKAVAEYIRTRLVGNCAAENAFDQVPLMETPGARGMSDFLV